MVVEDAGSSQSESVTQVAETGKREFSTKTRDDPLEKLERSDEEASLENPESVRFETACAAAILGVQPSVVCRDFIKAAVKRPMPGECAAITVVEVDEYVDVVGSSTPVHGGVGSERWDLQDSGGVLDTSGLPLLIVLVNLIFTLL